MVSRSHGRILIRVEGNDLVGHGHFMRCLTIARYLQHDFECVFAMSLASAWVISQLNEYNIPIKCLPPREQFHPDDPRSQNPWTSDIDNILHSGDIVIIDGYRFDSTFQEAAKHIGAKTIRFIDDLNGPAYCDAIITQLPISHCEIQAKLSLVDAWTGLDGFIVRPEFFATQKINVSFHYDFLIYVTTAKAFNFYSKLEMLREKKVLAIASRSFADQCKLSGWEIGQELSSVAIALKMKESANAILPSSSIAIEYFTATGRSPFVISLAENQNQSFETFVESRYFIDAALIDELAPLPKPTIHSIASFPAADFVTWIHGQF